MRRRGAFAAVECAGFVLTLPGVFGRLTALVEGVLFDSASAQTTNNTFTTSTTRSEFFTRPGAGCEPRSTTRASSATPSSGSAVTSICDSSRSSQKMRP
jgi:hypothetical protein